MAGFRTPANMKNHCKLCNSAVKLFRHFNLAAVLMAAALAFGCSKGDDKKDATQVAAKVNGHEITVHQVNDILARQNIPPERADAAKRQILERLIDQEIAKQQAVEKKLDRTPRTVQAMEAAKNEILARAFIDQIAASQPKPSDEDAKKYYAEHPELFAERRIYSIEELVVPQKQVAVDSVKAQVAKTKDLAQVAAWLKAQKVEVGATRGVRAAEQIPMTWVGEINKMKEGEVRVFENGERLNIVRLVAARSAPVDEKVATPRIQQYLFNRQLSDSLVKTAKQLRDKSNIEYMGEFANAPAAPKAAPAPEAFQPAPAETAPLETPNFEKGLRGLR